MTMDSTSTNELATKVNQYPCVLTSATGKRYLGVPSWSMMLSKPRCAAQCACEPDKDREVVLQRTLCHLIKKSAMSNVVIHLVSIDGPFFNLGEVMMACDEGRIVIVAIFDHHCLSRNNVMLITNVSKTRRILSNNGFEVFMNKVMYSSNSLVFLWDTEVRPNIVSLYGFGKCTWITYVDFGSDDNGLFFSGVDHKYSVMPFIEHSPVHDKCLVIVSSSPLPASLSDLSVDIIALTSLVVQRLFFSDTTTCFVCLCTHTSDSDKDTVTYRLASKFVLPMRNDSNHKK